MIDLCCRPADLTMQDVCPALAQLKDTAVPVMATAISAADLSAAQPTIASVHSRVKVLGTKTRPKRLWITSSDGRCQSFLLKVTVTHANFYCHMVHMSHDHGKLYLRFREAAAWIRGVCHNYACAVLRGELWLNGWRFGLQNQPA